MYNLDNSTNQVQNINSAHFAEQLIKDVDAVLIDVRTKLEYDSGHIPNSLLIDIYSSGFAEQINELNKSKSYYIYCRSGNRSYHAARYMLNLGFEKVYNLENGILGWSEPLEV